jgi:hypothetical protein
MVRFVHLCIVLRCLLRALHLHALFLRAHDALRRPRDAGSPIKPKKGMAPPAEASRAALAAVAAPPLAPATPPLVGRRVVVLAGSSTSGVPTPTLVRALGRAAPSFHFQTGSHVGKQTICVVMMGGPGKAAQACRDMTSCLAVVSLAATAHVPVIDEGALRAQLVVAGCPTAEAHAVACVLQQPRARTQTSTGDAAGANEGPPPGMVHLFRLLRRSEHGAEVVANRVVWGDEYTIISARRSRGMHASACVHVRETSASWSKRRWKPVSVAASAAARCVLSTRLPPRSARLPGR